MKPLVPEELITEKGDKCPHCGNVDTHIGYVCPLISSVDFDCQYVRRIEYHRNVPVQPFYNGIYPQVPVYTCDNPRPRYYGGGGVAGVMPPGGSGYGGGGAQGSITGVVDPTFIPNGGWNTVGWNKTCGCPPGEICSHAQFSDVNQPV